MRKICGRRRFLLRSFEENTLYEMHAGQIFPPRGLKVSPMLGSQQFSTFPFAIQLRSSTLQRIQEERMDSCH